MESHETERTLDRLERSIDSIKSDISQLQKQDSRQHTILFILVAALLGLDVSRIALVKSVLTGTQPIQPQPVQEIPNQN
ncbi:hypothetical protein RIF25_09460 [Thermosynechococcaceae cyanobacterium BACA0444]|uniref:Uncharacterized protein n=1 Tax=Pseudocalidococcus azoricus BACA0444 TaxID=2918990 RepID=A0AAE4FRX2_9CYAN|nr:hypothetical protein [Pseudocalidococcus azoricus]MDS3861035.1 hypothetical protein [Pseudocalidococcus azoricus BACA0444]